jgi:hypothetical protein
LHEKASFAFPPPPPVSPPPLILRMRISVAIVQYQNPEMWQFSKPFGIEHFEFYLLFGIKTVI